MAEEAASGCEGDTEDEEGVRAARVYLAGYAPLAEVAQLPGRVHLRLGTGLALPPMVVVDGSTGAVEVLLLGRVRRAVADWRAAVEGLGIRVQTCVPLPRAGDPVAVGCAQRMVAVGARCCGAAGVPEHFVEAYRVLSCGMMHPRDKRPWLMTASAVRRLALRAETLQNEIAAGSQCRRDVVAAMARRTASDGGGADDESLRVLDAQFRGLLISVDALQAEEGEVQLVLRRQRHLRAVMGPRDENAWPCECVGGE